MHDGRPFSLIDHYRKLWYFNFHRFEADNYHLMREYFARLFIDEIEEFMPLSGMRTLDVGGATGAFCRILHAERGCRACNLDPNPGRTVWADTVVASAEHIPFGDDAFDLVMCRGVLEHIPDSAQGPSLHEMFRVTRPGGICYVVIPPWYNPHAGHQLKPFHALPFPLAKRLREAFSGRKIEAGSCAELSLYRITHARMMRLIRSTPFRVLATHDVHFRLHALTRVPVLREVLVPAISYILVKIRS